MSAVATPNGFDFAANMDTDQGPPSVNIPLLCIWAKGLPDHEFSEGRRHIDLIPSVHMWLGLLHSLSQHNVSIHCSVKTAQILSTERTEGAPQRCEAVRVSKLSPEATQYGKSSDSG